MRFTSARTGGYQVFAVSGVNTISFAIDASGADTTGLLGFAVERHDPTENERYFMFGFKVFPSVVPNPTPETVVSTFDQPVQSFVWDDFTAKPGRPYTYFFHPLKGQPRNLDRSAPPITIDVQTEALFDAGATHQVFFNRGVASSQAYARRFGNQRPSQLPPAREKEALEWLSRDLDEAIFQFIKSAKPQDTLLCCFYEFRYQPVAQALKDAVDRGVDVQIILDAKVNEHTDKKGVFHPSSPRVDNLKMVQTVQLPPSRVTLREARRSTISHNKFMVLLKAQPGGQPPQATEVWTGSTNITQGGIFGQTNVGHWVRDAGVAARFADYWKLLQADPGAAHGDDAATTRRKNRELYQAVEALQNVPTDWRQVPPASITPVFSPRRGTRVLDMYVQMVDGATDLSCITLAFGINQEFKAQLADNTPQSHIAFFLLEKRDRPRANSTQPFVAIGPGQNVYMAWGSSLKDPLQRWVRETDNRALQFNVHVAYIHSKFLLQDPLGADPIVVTGSANFSGPSQTDNDENMLIIRGDRRVADIYFTEFNRLFNHFYFRSVAESLARSRANPQARRDHENSLLLAEDDSWLNKYTPGTLRSKRVGIFTRMQGIS